MTLRNLPLLAVAALILLGAADTRAQRGDSRGDPRGGDQRGGIGAGGMMGRGSEMGMNRMPVQPRAGLQLTLPGRWWDDKRMSRTLHLRTDQQTRMDDIFKAGWGPLQNSFANLQHEEDALATMSRQDLQDETKVFAQIDRVAQARADVEKSSAHMLLQIRKTLDPDQLAALDEQIANNR